MLRCCAGLASPASPRHPGLDGPTSCRDTVDRGRKWSGPCRAEVLRPFHLPAKTVADGPCFWGSGPYRQHRGWAGRPVKEIAKEDGARTATMRAAGRELSTSPAVYDERRKPCQHPQDGTCPGGGLEAFGIGDARSRTESLSFYIIQHARSRDAHHVLGRDDPRDPRRDH